MKTVTLRSSVARARLQSLGLTQSSLAAVCGLDIRTVQRWFAGRPMRLVEAERVASALQVGTADLFEDLPESPMTAMALFAFLGRLPVLRDHPSAPLLRSVPARFANFMSPLQFRAHPLHGLVSTIPLPERDRHRFIALRLRGLGHATKIQLVIRLSRSVLFERARVLVRGDEAFLMENSLVRSMRGRRRADDGSFDVWYWVGAEASELLVVCEEELVVTKVEVPEELRASFDMAHHATENAVCIRPTFTNVTDAGLPRCFDRIANRDIARVDVEEPRDG
jgi:hypothetical protein